MKNYLPYLALALAIGATSLHAESVYKWTDKDGITHYGDQQPTGQKSESVDVKSGTTHSSVEGSKEGRPSPQERLKAMEKGKKEASKQASQSRTEEAREKLRQKNCEVARKNLKTLNTYGRIKVQEDGEQRYLTSEEIDAKKAEYKNIADDSCKGSGSAQ